MIRLIILVGKSCSGKDSVKKVLTGNYNIEPVLEYTTRPMRSGEIQDQTYHFISKEEFINKIDKNDFIHWNCFNTVQGEWYYGLTLEDIKIDSVLITYPSELIAIIPILKEKFNEKIKVFYLMVDDLVIRNRLKQRGDNPCEAERRMAADNIDFEGIENYVDFIINYNNKTPNQIGEEIYNLGKICK